MHLCRGFHYFIIFVEYWKFNTSKNSINDARKKIFFSILHPNPSIQRLVAGGVEVVADKIAKTRNRGFGLERAGVVLPAPPLRHRVNSESAEVFGSSPEPVWPFRGPTRPSVIRSMLVRRGVYSRVFKGVVRDKTLISKLIILGTVKKRGERHGSWF